MPANTDVLPKKFALQNGRYVIERKLGMGGFGITYRASDTGLGRVVAIKELYHRSCYRRNGQVIRPYSYTEDKWGEYVQKFWGEAKIIASLTHPRIVKVYDCFEENNTAYMVMEFIEGISLTNYVKKLVGHISGEEALKFIVEVGQALSLLHANYIIHRDVNPNNIMIRPDGHAILIDFGGAREFIQDKTLSHTVVWTPSFAPPEQMTEKAHRGPYTDVYALASTSYYLLTGNYYNQMEKNPEHKSILGQEVWSVLLAGLAHEPSDRTPDVSSFVRDLEAALRATPKITDMDLYDIQLLSPTEGWAVGYGGVILHYNEGTWVEHESPTDHALHSLCVLSSDKGWAVGGTFLNGEGINVVIYCYAGMWLELGSYEGSMLAGVSLISPYKGWAIDIEGNVLQFRGNGWVISHHPGNVRLCSVHTLSTDVAWIVGDMGTLLRYGSNEWEHIDSFSVECLNDVFAFSPDECWIVGNHGTILHYTNDYREHFVDSPTTRNLRSIYMLSSEEGWAVGEEGTLLHYAESKWSKVFSPTTQDLNKVYAVSIEEAWAVGNSGTIIHYQEGKWNNYVSSPKEK